MTARRRFPSRRFVKVFEVTASLRLLVPKQRNISMQADVTHPIFIVTESFLDLRSVTALPPLLAIRQGISLQSIPYTNTLQMYQLVCLKLFESVEFGDTSRQSEANDCSPDCISPVGREEGFYRTAQRPVWQIICKAFNGGALQLDGFKFSTPITTKPVAM